MSLGSNRDTLNGPDWRDAASALLYLEELTGGKVEVRADLRPTKGSASIVWVGDVWSALSEDGVRLHLASASVSMLTRGGGGTDAALLLLAYELDKDLYRRTEGFAPKTA